MSRDDRSRRRGESGPADRATQRPEIFPLIAAWATRHDQSRRGRRPIEAEKGRRSQPARQTHMSISQPPPPVGLDRGVRAAPARHSRAHASPKERNAPLSPLRLPRSLIFSAPSLCPCCHRQFDAIDGFVSAACSIRWPRSDRG